MIDQLRAKENKELYTSIALVGILAILSYGRILFLHNVYEDDNCWLLSIYASNNLSEFLNTGWTELHREPQGTFLYYFLKLHKTTDHAYWIWQSINLLIQIASPIFLFLFAKNLFKGKQPLAFLIGCSLIIYPIDTTIPVLSNIFNRIGLLFAIISFYLTVKALTNNIRWTFLVFAIVLSGISYLLMEGTVALEPARFAIIGYIFYKKNIGSKSVLKKTILTWTPFFALCIPVIIYKMIYKPYGIYEGTYYTDLSFIFDWQLQKQLVKMLLFNNWHVFFKEYISYTTIWAILFSAVAVILVYYLLWRNNLSCDAKYKVSDSDNLYLSEKTMMSLSSLKVVFIIGIIFLIPPVLIYELAGRVPIFGVNSRHGIILQIGYAFLMGGVLYVSFNYIKSRLKAALILIVVFIGAGVFFNNLNLDLYFASWQKQKDFWQEFTKRFPSLPEQATFFIDARDKNQPYSYNLDTSYDLEFIINVLYATDNDPNHFRRYVVMAPDEWETVRGNIQKSGKSFDRLSHWGKDVINLNELIVILYKNGEFLVNREIKEKYPDISYPYRMWLEKDFPKLPEPVSYPLRHKFYGV